uniref:Methyl-accepting transducer domain-containing protein n=1 Tax=candidate division WOR-3 bacterium TaxID=2052148 RepID=A0A7C4XLK6_UNCW3
MELNRRDITIDKLKSTLNSYGENYNIFLNAGQRIETGLQTNSEVLDEIRHQFDNLTATVELVFEGITVFESEIKKINDLLQVCINNFNTSLSTSNQLNKDLNNITRIFNKISDAGNQLAEIINNINLVSESIVVASRNAGVTAFHAGRQGRGFEVIAREMENLVRFSQSPTRRIPEVSAEVFKGINELTAELKKIQEIISELDGIAQKFSNINEELSTLIPYIESCLKDISNSVATQKDLQKALMKENENLPRYLNEIYSITRSSAVTEIFLSAFSQYINNIKESLFQVQDKNSFNGIFNILKTVINNMPDFVEKVGKELNFSNFKNLEVQSSNRLILQFVSEANHLNEIVSSITEKISDWLKIYEYAGDSLNRGINFYQEILKILGALQKNLSYLKNLTGKIEEPIRELKRLNERSKLLGLYARIESARSGEYASSLNVVTTEIKTLSDKIREFVERIDLIRKEVSQDLKGLISYFACSTSDVEEGIISMKSAVSSVSEGMKILGNLDSLSKEMLNSSTQMLNQCRIIGEKIRLFNDEYKRIKEEFVSYYEAIKASNEDSKKIKETIREFQKDIYIMDKKETKTLIYRETTDPIILDPAKKTDATSHQVIEQIFIGLLTFDSANKLIPGVASYFSVAPDGKLWDFYLRKDVKFHDGSLFTAQDVVNSLQRVRNGPNANFIDYVEDMRIIDKNHIQFVLKFPYVPFLCNLACGVCDIVPQNFSDSKPVGCGPYRFVHWEKGKEILLEAFDEFYDGRSVIDRCVIKIIPEDREAIEEFKRGNISVMGLSVDMMNEFAPEEIISGPVLSTQYISINVGLDSPFKDRRVRQAMNYAIDKEYYTKVLLKGQAIPARGIFPPDLPSYNNELVGYPYNLKKAQELMKEAGYGSGIQDSFIFDIREDAEVISRAEFIKESLAKIGIHLKLNPLPWKDFLNKTYSGKSILSLRGWVSDNGDPDNFLFPLFHSKSFGASGNTSYYANPDIDSLIETARAEQVFKRRMEIYKKIESMLVNDAPWVFLSHGLESFVVQKNIGGFKVDPFGLVRFRNLWSL